jgi:hypothetical protein
MMEVLIVVGLAIVLLYVVRKGLIQVDLSMPWLLALVAFGFLSVNDNFVDWTGQKLGILYPPIAIVFVTIAILLGLITVLLMVVTRLRQRQMYILRRLAMLELAGQERTIRAQESSPSHEDPPSALEVEN